MKTFNKILFFLFLSILIFNDFQIQEVTCANSQNQNQLKSGVMTLMNNLLSKSSKRKHKNKKNIITKPKNNKRTNSSTKITQEKLQALNDIDRSKLLTEFEKLQVTHEDWLKISSPEFRNPSKYPPIVLSDYTQKLIPVTSENFRINETYSAENKSPESSPDETYFWFRISDKNIYYAENKASLQILGSIPFKKIMGVTMEKNPSSSCFDITDSDNSQWKLCGETKLIRHKWYCYIQTSLGVPDEKCKEIPEVEENIVVEDEEVTDPVILIPLPSKNCNENWNYLSSGKDWDCDCKEGKTQSPIDIDTTAVQRSAVKPIFKYEEVPFEITEEPYKLVYENGAVRLHCDKLGKVVTLDGNVFKAKEIVWHSPAQHLINGHRYELEMEIIHEGESSPVLSEHLVVSLMFEAKPGVYNKFLDDLDFFNLPGPTMKEKKIRNPFHLNKIFYDLTQIDFPIWKEFSFFTYEGSLSAPPCTEKTIVYVKKDPIPLGNTTLQLFREAIKIPDLIDEDGNVAINTSEPTNNRDTQPLNGRRVYFYEYRQQNFLTSDDMADKPLTGHYEKITKKMTNYYHVSGDKPSKLPNSFVVSESEAKGVES